MAFDLSDQTPIHNELLRAPVVGTFARSGNGVVRTFRIPYENYFDAVTMYMGWAELVGGVLVRHLPYRDFVHQGMIAVRAEVRGVAYEGVDASDDVAPMNLARLFRYAYVTVWFQTPNFSIGEFANDPTDPTLGATPPSEVFRYCQKEVRAAKDFVTAQPGVLQWCDALDVPIPNAKVQFPIPALLSTADITIQWMDLPSSAVPITAINECMGKVNDDTLDLPPRPPPASVEAETLYLMTWSPTDIFFPDDTLENNGRGFSITYYLKHRLQGWNHAPKPSGGFARVVRAGTTNGIYELADFSALFAPEP